jgi:hypothetical protein
MIWILSKEHDANVSKRCLCEGAKDRIRGRINIMQSSLFIEECGQVREVGCAKLATQRTPPAVRKIHNHLRTISQETLWPLRIPHRSRLRQAYQESTIADDGLGVSR